MFGNLGAGEAILILIILLPVLIIVLSIVNKKRKKIGVKKVKKDSSQNE